MADSRQDPSWFAFAAFVVAGSAATTFAFQSDLRDWQRIAWIAWGLVALVAAVLMVPVLRRQWRIARQPPGELRNPVRRQAGSHAEPE